ncbi:DUF4166 domain-containing protein [Microcella humidisoli]|uniref:DUF4166 domain-containing protein n=1 Tax=Microcella humidisoli TaxID=2963406 RepID=A0ABY5FTI5_9MICO|nr:DUF4166 domain-containing protein [Microcella humidisoli]UTT61432.1 DUF4166 domain-containing protein [Microcella humidisoli]
MNDTAASIFARAMGDDFTRLHPMLQRRFGVGLEAGYACHGRGVMTRIRRGPWFTVPFLHIGRIRNILAPFAGERVPFTVENHPYRDPFGRETVTFVRTFDYPRRPGRPGRFDATMILGADGRVVDYLGTHQHLAVDLDLRAEPDGSLRLRSDAQRFYAGPLAFRFPLLFSGRADLRESFDDATGEYVIRLEVRNRVFGFLFGYEGRFTCVFPPADEPPPHVLPVRHERRE